MAIEWSGWSPELTVALDRGQPLRAQLEDHLRCAIRDGRLAPGERLPSTRALARYLSLSRGLVQEGYEQLIAEGYLIARAGSATRVAAIRPASSAVRRPALTPTAKPAIDFASGVPDLASFPRDDWLWALREAVRTVPNTGLHYPDPRGAAHLRTVLAAYVRRVRACATDEDHVVVCTGFAQGLALTLRALRMAGVRTLAFEDPGYGDGETTATAASLGLTVVPVPVDGEGIDVRALHASGADAVVLTPAHQWPTGVVLSPQRRQELIEWVGDNRFVIEDDYDAEFRYERDPVGSLQGLCAARVISIGTTSKSLAPAMRLGWVICPPSLLDAVVTEKLLADRGGPALDQLALAVLIESGRYDRHLRRMRGVYAARRETLGEALAARAPGVLLSGLAAGFHAVAHLPPEVHEGSVVAAARERSVGVYGMSLYRASRSPAPPQLVLGFGNLTERAIRSGIETIADLLVGAPSTGDKA
jgi:GntR family transcriptional regulator/MocR family aminotransferase